MNNTKYNIKKIVMLAILTAIVIALQFLGAFVKIGPFSISLVLMPIVIGAALAGTPGGFWLGFVFGIVVLISGDAAPFFIIHPAGTIFTVLLKGALAGFGAAIVYNVLARKNKIIGAFAAAVVCPVINTGIFIIGSYVFFYNTLIDWGMDAGFTNVTAYIFLGMAGINFLIEMGLNILLCPAIVRLIQFSQKQ